VAISFADSPPPGVDRFDAPMPSATEDGRQGRRMRCIVEREHK